MAELLAWGVMVLTVFPSAIPVLGFTYECLERCLRTISRREVHHDRGLASYVPKLLSFSV
jgi:hypothetical protein